MQISQNIQMANMKQSSTEIKTDFTQKISKDDAKEMREQITQNANEMMFKSTSIQTTISGKASFETNHQDFQNFLKDIGYDGKPIASLSQDEASALVSEDGFFGITQTSQRIANFVISGADGDESLMRAGREGMLLGFQQAEQMWGGELPEISQKTMQASIEMVDIAMSELGFSILNEEA